MGKNTRCKKRKSDKNSRINRSKKIRGGARTQIGTHIVLSKIEFKKKDGEVKISDIMKYGTDGYDNFKGLHVSVSENQIKIDFFFFFNYEEEESKKTSYSSIIFGSNKTEKFLNKIASKINAALSFWDSDFIKNGPGCGVYFMCKNGKFMEITKNKSTRNIFKFANIEDMKNIVNNPKFKHQNVKAFMLNANSELLGKLNNLFPEDKHIHSKQSNSSKSSTHISEDYSTRGSSSTSESPPGSPPRSPSQTVSRKSFASESEKLFTASEKNHHSRTFESAPSIAAPTDNSLHHAAGHQADHISNALAYEPRLAKNLSIDSETYAINPSIAATTDKSPHHASGHQADHTIESLLVGNSNTVVPHQSESLHLNSSDKNIDSNIHIEPFPQRIGQRIIDLVSNEKIEDLKKYLSKTDKIFNSVNESGRTPILLAIQMYDPNSIRKLLKCKGVDVNIKNNYGYSPLSLAIYHAIEAKDTKNDLYEIELLVRRPDIDKNDAYKYIEKIRESKHGLYSDIKTILNKKRK